MMQQATQADASELKVEKRSAVGKGVARKLRKKGLIPAVFYGSRHQPVSLALDPEELVKALSTPKLRNTLIRLVSEDSEIDGRKVLVKDIQKDPLTNDFLHVDLLEVYSDILITTQVPIHLTGHPAGVELGGTLEQHLREVDIRCSPENIPSDLTIDVSRLGIGDSVKLGDLTFGQGVELLLDESLSVASVVAPTVVEEPAAEEEEEAEAAEGEEVAEGEKAPAEAEGKKKEGEKKEGERKEGE